LGVRR